MCIVTLGPKGKLHIDYYVQYSLIHNVLQHTTHTGDDKNHLIKHLS